MDAGGTRRGKALHKPRQKKMSIMLVKLSDSPEEEACLELEPLEATGTGYKVSTSLEYVGMIGSTTLRG